VPFFFFLSEEKQFVTVFVFLSVIFI